MEHILRSIIFKNSVGGYRTQLKINKSKKTEAGVNPNSKTTVQVLQQCTNRS